MMKETSPTRKDLRALLAFAENTARGAGKILFDGFGRRHDVTYKGRIDPVTECDLKSEKYIVRAITGKYAHHDILAEEGSDRVGKSAYRWVIDPLDGTVNYSHDFPVYCVSIGLQYENESVVGVVYDPERDEMFSAARGIGARVNGKRIGVSACRRLNRALLATGFAYDVATARKNNLGLFGRMVKTAQAVRRLGSAAIDLCWVAAGRLDGFWEFSLHPWDTAAAILIVEEAGGRVSRLDQSPFSIFHQDILASNGPIHAQMSRALRGK